MADNASSLVRSRTPALRTSYHSEAYSARNVLASCFKWARRALSYRCKSLVFSCSLVIRSPLRQFSELRGNPPAQVGEGRGSEIIISQKEQVRSTSCAVQPH